MDSGKRSKGSQRRDNHLSQSNTTPSPPKTLPKTTRKKTIKKSSPHSCKLKLKPSTSSGTFFLPGNGGDNGKIFRLTSKQLIGDNNSNKNDNSTVYHLRLCSTTGVVNNNMTNGIVFQKKKHFYVLNSNLNNNLTTLTALKRPFHSTIPKKHSPPQQDQSYPYDNDQFVQGNDDNNENYEYDSAQYDENGHFIGNYQEDEEVYTPTVAALYPTSLTSRSYPILTPLHYKYRIINENYEPDFQSYVELPPSYYEIIEQSNRDYGDPETIDLLEKFDEMKKKYYEKELLHQEKLQKSKYDSQGRRVVRSIQSLGESNPEFFPNFDKLDGENGFIEKLPFSSVRKYSIQSTPFVSLNDHVAIGQLNKIKVEHVYCIGQINALNRELEIYDISCPALNKPPYGPNPSLPANHTRNRTLPERDVFIEALLRYNQAYLQHFEPYNTTQSLLSKQSPHVLKKPHDIQLPSHWIEALFKAVHTTMESGNLNNPKVEDAIHLSHYRLVPPPTKTEPKNIKDVRGVSEFLAEIDTSSQIVPTNMNLQHLIQISPNTIIVKGDYDGHDAVLFFECVEPLVYDNIVKQKPTDLIMNQSQFVGGVYITSESGSVVGKDGKKFKKDRKKKISGGAEVNSAKKNNKNQNVDEEEEEEIDDDDGDTDDELSESEDFHDEYRRRMKKAHETDKKLQAQNSQKLTQKDKNTKISSKSSSPIPFSHSLDDPTQNTHADYNHINDDDNLDTEFLNIILPSVQKFSTIISPPLLHLKYLLNKSDNSSYQKPLVDPYNNSFKNNTDPNGKNIDNDNNKTSKLNRSRKQPTKSNLPTIHKLNYLQPKTQFSLVQDYYCTKHNNVSMYTLYRYFWTPTLLNSTSPLQQQSSFNPYLRQRQLYTASSGLFDTMKTISPMFGNIVNAIEAVADKRLIDQDSILSRDQLSSIGADGYQSANFADSKYKSNFYGMAYMANVKRGDLEQYFLEKRAKNELMRRNGRGDDDDDDIFDDDVRVSELDGDPRSQELSPEELQMVKSGQIQLKSNFIQVFTSDLPFRHGDFHWHQQRFSTYAYTLAWPSILDALLPEISPVSDDLSTMVHINTSITALKHYNSDLEVLKLQHQQFDSSTAPGHIHHVSLVQKISSERPRGLDPTQRVRDVSVLTWFSLLNPDTYQLDPIFEMKNVYSITCSALPPLYMQPKESGEKYLHGKHPYNLTYNPKTNMHHDKKLLEKNAAARKSQQNNGMSTFLRTIDDLPPPPEPEFILPTSSVKRVILPYQPKPDPHQNQRRERFNAIFHADIVNIHPTALVRPDHETEISAVSDLRVYQFSPLKDHQVRDYIQFLHETHAAKRHYKFPEMTFSFPDQNSIGIYHAFTGDFNAIFHNSTIAQLRNKSSHEHYRNFDNYQSVLNSKEGTDDIKSGKNGKNNPIYDKNLVQRHVSYFPSIDIIRKLWILNLVESKKHYDHHASSLKKNKNQGTQMGEINDNDIDPTLIPPMEYAKYIDLGALAPLDAAVTKTAVADQGVLEYIDMSFSNDPYTPGSDSSLYVRKSSIPQQETELLYPSRHKDRDENNVENLNNEIIQQYPVLNKFQPHPSQPRDSKNIQRDQDGPESYDPDALNVEIPQTFIPPIMLQQILSSKMTEYKEKNGQLFVDFAKKMVHSYLLKMTKLDNPHYNETLDTPPLSPFLELFDVNVAQSHIAHENLEIHRPLLAGSNLVCHLSEVQPDFARGFTTADPYLYINIKASVYVHSIDLRLTSRADQGTVDSNNNEVKYLTESFRYYYDYKTAQDITENLQVATSTLQLAYPLCPKKGILQHVILKRLAYIRRAIGAFENLKAAKEQTIDIYRPSTTTTTTIEGIKNMKRLTQMARFQPKSALVFNGVNLFGSKIDEEFRNRFYHAMNGINAGPWCELYLPLEILESVAVEAYYRRLIKVNQSQLPKQTQSQYLKKTRGLLGGGKSNDKDSNGGLHLKYHPYNGNNDTNSNDLNSSPLGGMLFSQFVTKKGQEQLKKQEGDLPIEAHVVGEDNGGDTSQSNTERSHNQQNNQGHNQGHNHHNKSHENTSNLSNINTNTFYSSTELTPKHKLSMINDYLVDNSRFVSNNIYDKSLRSLFLLMNIDLHQIITENPSHVVIDFAQPRIRLKWISLLLESIGIDANKLVEAIWRREALITSEIGFDVILNLIREEIQELRTISNANLLIWHYLFTLLDPIQSCFIMYGPGSYQLQDPYAGNNNSGNNSGFTGGNLSGSDFHRNTPINNTNTFNHNMNHDNNYPSGNESDSTHIVDANFVQNSKNSHDDVGYDFEQDEIISKQKNKVNHSDDDDGSDDNQITNNDTTTKVINLNKTSSSLSKYTNTGSEQDYSDEPTADKEHITSVLKDLDLDFAQEPDIFTHKPIDNDHIPKPTSSPTVPPPVQSHTTTKRVNQAGLFDQELKDYEHNSDQDYNDNNNNYDHHDHQQQKRDDYEGFESLDALTPYQAPYKTKIPRRYRDPLEMFDYSEDHSEFDDWERGLMGTKRKKNNKHGKKHVGDFDDDILFASDNDDNDEIARLPPHHRYEFNPDGTPNLSRPLMLEDKRTKNDKFNKNIKKNRSGSSDDDSYDSNDSEETTTTTTASDDTDSDDDSDDDTNDSDDSDDDDDDTEDEELTMNRKIYQDYRQRVMKQRSKQQLVHSILQTPTMSSNGVQSTSRTKQSNSISNDTASPDDDGHIETIYLPNGSSTKFFNNNIGVLALPQFQHIVSFIHHLATYSYESESLLNAINDIGQTSQEQQGNEQNSILGSSKNNNKNISFFEEFCTENKIPMSSHPEVFSDIRQVAKYEHLNTLFLSLHDSQLRPPHFERLFDVDNYDLNDPKSALEAYKMKLHQPFANTTVYNYKYRDKALIGGSGGLGELSALAVLTLDFNGVIDTPYDIGQSTDITRESLLLPRPEGKYTHTPDDSDDDDDESEHGSDDLTKENKIKNVNKKPYSKQITTLATQFYTNLPFPHTTKLIDPVAHAAQVKKSNRQNNPFNQSQSDPNMVQNDDITGTDQDPNALPSVRWHDPPIPFLDNLNWDLFHSRDSVDNSTSISNNITHRGPKLPSTQNMLNLHSHLTKEINTTNHAAQKINIKRDIPLDAWLSLIWTRGWIQSALTPVHDEKNTPLFRQLTLNPSESSYFRKLWNNTHHNDWYQREPQGYQWNHNGNNNNDVDGGDSYNTNTNTNFSGNYSSYSNEMSSNYDDYNQSYHNDGYNNTQTRGEILKNSLDPYAVEIKYLTDQIAHITPYILVKSTLDRLITTFGRGSGDLDQHPLELTDLPMDNLGFNFAMRRLASNYAASLTDTQREHDLMVTKRVIGSGFMRYLERMLMQFEREGVISPLQQQSYQNDYNDFDLMQKSQIHHQSMNDSAPFFAKFTLNDDDAQNSDPHGYFLLDLAQCNTFASNYTLSGSIPMLRIFNTVLLVAEREFERQKQKIAAEKNKDKASSTAQNLSSTYFTPQQRRRTVLRSTKLTIDRMLQDHERFDNHTMLDVPNLNMNDVVKLNKMSSILHNIYTPYQSRLYNRPFFNDGNQYTHQYSNSELLSTPIDHLGKKITQFMNSLEAQYFHVSTHEGALPPWDAIQQRFVLNSTGEHVSHLKNPTVQNMNDNNNSNNQDNSANEATTTTPTNGSFDLQQLDKTFLSTKITSQLGQPSLWHSVQRRIVEQNVGMIEFRFDGAGNSGSSGTNANNTNFGTQNLSSNIPNKEVFHRGLKVNLVEFGTAAAPSSIGIINNTNSDNNNNNTTDSISDMISSTKQQTLGSGNTITSSGGGSGGVNPRNTNSNVNRTSTNNNNVLLGQFASTSVQNQHGITSNTTIAGGIRDYTNRMSRSRKMQLRYLTRIEEAENNKNNKNLLNNKKSGVGGGSSSSSSKTSNDNNTNLIRPTNAIISTVTPHYLSTSSLLDPHVNTKTWLGLYQVKMKQFKHLSLYDLDLRGLVPDPSILQRKLSHMATEIVECEEKWNKMYGNSGDQQHQNIINNKINNNNIASIPFKYKDVSPNNIFLPGNPAIEGKDTLYAYDPVLQARVWNELHYNNLGTPKTQEQLY